MLGSFLFPAKCPVCGGIPDDRESRVCSDCKRKLPRICEPMCARCGKPLENVTCEYCYDCEQKRKGKDVLTKGTALWVYDKRMKRAMAEFKYGGCQEDAIFFVEELYRFRGEEMHRWKPDAIMPVPLHWRKKWFRGYNQAECLAELLGKYMGIPVYSDVLLRTHYTKPQKGLDDRERRHNLQDAFSLSKTANRQMRSVKNILLIDDIYTTGATLEACAAVLRTTGVEKIYFACICIGAGS